MPRLVRNGLRGDDHGAIAVPHVMPDVRESTNLAVMNTQALDKMQGASPTRANEPATIGQQHVQPDPGSGVNFKTPGDDLPQAEVQSLQQGPVRRGLMPP